MGWCVVGADDLSGVLNGGLWAAKLSIAWRCTDEMRGLVGAVLGGA